MSALGLGHVNLEAPIDDAVRFRHVPARRHHPHRDSGRPMSLIYATQLTAAATLALAILALTTAIFALLAWLGRREEIRDQAKMLKVQSEQLAEDRKVNAEQIRVLGLQAEELTQSLSASARRRNGASKDA